VDDGAKRLNLTKITPVLAPAFPLLAVAEPVLAQLKWKLAAQDMSSYPAGSYTGAVSAINLQGLSVTYAIVGHSERRQYFKETAQDVARKIEQAVEAGIKPLVCVSAQTLAEQASALDSSLAQRCAVVYEPLDAIGTGNNASLETVKQFKTQVRRLFGAVPFLYGGSVDELNIGEYLLVTDGVLIGTASLKADQFIRVLQTAQGDQPTA
jgi:triosephosphate isomerase